MNLQAYREQRKRTETWTDTLDTKIYMLCFGLMGETGEVVDYLKKVAFHNHPFDKQILIKEIGDLMWYLIGLTDSFNIDLEDVFEKNIQKLQQRYPNGFTTQDSIIRKDKQNG